MSIAPTKESKPDANQEEGKHDWFNLVLMRAQWVLETTYFNQPTGAPHTVCWSTNFFDAKTSFSVFFPSQMEKRKKKRKRKK